MTFPHEQRRRIGPIAVFLVVMPLFGVDLMLPAMPVFQRELGASVAAAHATLSVFAFGFASMHLVLGPLADRYGRRPCLLAGLALFTVASVVCAFAETVEMLIVARLFQAFGAGAGPLIARAVIRDVYGAEGAGRMMGFVMAFFGMGAIATPILGGVLVDWLGWQSNFVVATIYGAAMLGWVGLLLPETVPQRAAGTSRASMGRGFLVLLGDRRYVVVTVTGCLVASAMFTWISGSSFATQNVFGKSATLYGILYGVTVAGFVAMSLLSARLAPRLGSYRLLSFGTMIAATGGAAGLALALGADLSLVAMLVAVSAMAMGHGFCLPQSMAASVAPFPLLAATASAIFGFLQYGINSVVVMVGGLLYDGTALPMLAMIAVLTAAGALIYALFRPRSA